MDNKELNDLEALELSAEDLEDVAGGKLDKKFLSSTMAGITLLTGSPNFSNTKAASSSLSGSDFSTQISAKVEKEEKQENQEVKSKSETNIKESKTFVESDYNYDKATEKLVINKVKNGILNRDFVESILLSENIQDNDIRNIEIKDGVRELGESCFCELKSLKKVSLSDGVKKIGKRCFEYCSALDSIDLSSNLEEIGEYCFFDCFNLKKIFLPKSIQKIGEGAICSLEVIMYDSDIYHRSSREKLVGLLWFSRGFLDKRRGYNKYHNREKRKNITVTIIDTGSGNIEKLKKDITKTFDVGLVFHIMTLGLTFIEYKILNFNKYDSSVKINIISEKEFLKNKASYL